MLTNEELMEKKKTQKQSVSAEVYGDFNRKVSFIPKIIEKTNE